MRALLRLTWLLGFLALALHPALGRAEDTVDTEPTKEGPLTIRPLTHASVLLEWKLYMMSNV